MIDAWGAAMGQAILQGSAVLLLVWLTSRFIGALPPDARCWLWRIAYLKLLVALLWAAPLQLPVLPAERVQASAASTEPSQEPLMAPNPPYPIPVSADKARTPVGSQPALPLAIFGLWILGVTACVYHVMVQHGRLRRLRERAMPVDGQEILAVFTQLSESLRVPRPPKLTWSDEIDTPMLVGFRRPEIILPRWFVVQGRPEEHRMALAHELAHHKRRDVPWGCLTLVARVLFFFHPLVWLADREGRIEQELACDEMTVRTAAVSTAEYGRLLLQVSAARPQPRRVVAPSVGITESYVALRRRIGALQTAHGMRKNAAAIVGVLCLVGLIGVVPWRAVASSPVTYLQVRGVANQSLDASMGRGDLYGNDLRSLPRGERVLGGVRFRIEDRCVQLIGKTLANRPESVRIPVGRRFESFAVLHGTAWGGAASNKSEHVPDGVPVGRYEIHYEEGSVETLPLIYGADVRDWWAPNRDDEPPASAATLAFTGQNPATRVWGNLGVRLYVRTWRNPQPQRKVSHLKFISAGEVAAPFLVSATCGG